MFDCTTSQYDEIYAPWLARPGTLLEFGDYKPGEALLDLCGGTGIVTRHALSLGADPSTITLLDLNPRLDIPNVTVIPDRAENLARHAWEAFDLVVCRQAMGYLDPLRVPSAVAMSLKPGGRFVFNTFLPPRSLGFKAKSFDGSRFVEAHVAYRGTVIHLQVKLGLPPKYDVSVFNHWSERALRQVLSTHFDVTVTPQGRSLHWKCIRKEDDP